MTRALRIVSRSKKRLTLAGVLVVMLAASFGALAYFTSAGTGTGSANAGTLNPPTNVTVPSTSSGAVHVAWTASITGGGAVAPTGYYAERNDGGPTWDPACGTSPGSLVGTASCDDTVTVDGDYTYRVTAVFHSWTAVSTPSATSVHVVTDTTPPYVLSIDRSDPTPTNAGSVHWIVTFSESVTGVGVGDFTLVQTGVSGAAITTVAGTGATRTVTATTGAGDGTLGLDLVDDNSIQDGSGNPLGTAGGAGDGSFAGQVYAIDKTAPTVSSINRADSNPTNAATLHWTVSFSESVSSVDTTDFTLIRGGGVTGGTVTNVTPVNGSTYTVAATTGSGDGTLRLDLADDDSINDAAGNPFGGTGAGNGDFTTGQAYTIDKTSPAVSSINRADATPTNAGTVHWTVNFSESVTGVDGTDFALVRTGITGGSITGVSGSGNGPYTVTATTGSSDGTLGLNLVDDDSIQDGVGNKLGGTGTSGAGDGSFAGQAYTIDKTSPTVTSINRQTGATNPTNGTPLPFTVTFSEPVATSTVVAARFAVTTSGMTGTAPSVGTITPVSPSGGFASSYTVNVTTTGAVGANNGSVRLDLTSAGSIADEAGNLLTALHNGDEFFTFDTTAPTAVLDLQAGSDAGTSSTDDLTNAASLAFDVTFSEAVSGLAAADFSNVGSATGCIVGAPAGGPIAYSVTLTSCSAGTVVLRLAASGVTDTAGNANAQTDSSTVTIDRTAPTATLALQAGSDTGASNGDNITNAATLVFDVTFSEPVSGLAAADFSNVGSATGCIVGAPAGGPIAYSVTLTSCSAGTVVLRLAASGVTDTAGNANAQTDSSTVTIDRTAPTATLALQAGSDTGASNGDNITNAATLVFDVTFSEPVSGLAAADFSNVGSATGCIVGAPAGGPIAYSVTLTSCSAGTVVLRLAASGVTDTAGNANAQTDSSTVTIDRTGSTVTINQAAGQTDPTSASPINFTVVFSETTTDFGTGDVTLSGTAGATTATVTGSGTTYNAAVSGMTINGTVIADIGAGVAHDAAGNANTASTSTDHTVTYANTLTPTDLTITNGTGTAGKAEQSDVITITWNRAVQLSSICSSWSSDSQTVTGVSVVMARGNGSATNDLSFSLGTVSATACTTGIKIGTMTLPVGSGDYDSANRTDTFQNSTVTWNSGTNQLVITLGAPDNQPPNTVATSNYTYTPSSSIAASGGAPTVTGTATTGNVQNF